MNATIEVDDGSVTFRWRHGARTQARYDYGFTKEPKRSAGKPKRAGKKAGRVGP